MCRYTAETQGLGSHGDTKKRGGVINHVRHHSELLVAPRLVGLSLHVLAALFNVLPEAMHGVAAGERAQHSSQHHYCEDSFQHVGSPVITAHVKQPNGFLMNQVITADGAR